MNKNCLNCRVEFKGQSHKAKYCGRECYRLHYFSMEAAERRFWPRVKKGRGCWIWQAALNTKGYGTLSIKGRQEIAHRVAWILSGRKLPTGGKFLCHTCDEPKCVRPSHLFIGTHKDNAVDKARKGRVHNSILTLDQVREVKVALKDWKIGDNIRLAEKYGVSPATISGIKTGKNYWHVETDKSL